MKSEINRWNQILDQIPDYQTFLTVSELDESSKKLAEEYSDIVKLLEIGASKDGHPIYCLKIGNGDQNALFIGCPHPNEPIGAMTLETLAKLLAEDKELREALDYTFYIIKVVDPDGLGRNEGWLKGPFTYYNYARYFFRPASDQQVEWTFPMHYKGYQFNRPIPETEAVMKLIDEIHPAFIYSLHNSGFSGAYWYVETKKGREYLVDRLPEIPGKYGIFLKKGEPEAPYCEEYGNGVYKFAKVEDMYDYYCKMLPKEEVSTIMNFGGSSISYANRNGGDTNAMVAEVGYFKSKYMQDLSPAGYTRKEIVEVKCRLIEKFAAFDKKCAQVLKCYLPKENQYGLALFSMDDALLADVNAERNLVKKNPEEYGKTAPKAQWFDYCIAMPYMIELWYGVIAAAAEEAIPYADEEGKKKLYEIIEEAEKKLKIQTDELEKQMPCETFPIRDLVAYQLESGILGMKAAKIKKEDE